MREPETSPGERTPPDFEPNFPAIADKADDLESIRKALEDASAISGGLWLSYLIVLYSTAVAVGAVTHVDLLLENPVKLPFLGVELPLKAFFVLAPVLFLIMHAYTLVHFELLAKKTALFHNKLYVQIPGELPHSPSAVAIREGLRAQLPIDIFVQFLAGPKAMRESWLGFMLKLIAWTTLVMGPVLLLVLIQMQFLPYHAYWITWIHRLTLFVDLLLIWWLWSSILSVRDTDRAMQWRRRAAGVLWLASSVVVIFFSWIVATTPWEFDKAPLAWVAPITPKWATSLNLTLFDTTIDPDTDRPKSWFANTLVLQDFNLYMALKIDDPEKAKAREYLLALRRRDLNNAVFSRAVLPRVDFSGAYLESAFFDHADLHGSSFGGARLNSANFVLFKALQDQPTAFKNADLRKTSFDYAELKGAAFGNAQLQGARFNNAHLENAKFSEAQLQGASLFRAQLQAASLVRAQLQGASLDQAHLQGASLDGAQLQAASLEHTRLQGASLNRARLQGASLYEAQLQGASFERAHLQGASLDRADLQGASLHGAQLQGAMLGGRLAAAHLENASLWRANFEKASFEELSPKSKDVYWAAVYSEVRRDPRPWTQRDYLDLKRALERDIAAGDLQTKALERVQSLDCEKKEKAFAPCDPNAKPPPTLKAIENVVVDRQSYEKALVESLAKTICEAGAEAIHVLRGVLSNGRFTAAGAQAPALAERIQSNACPASRALTENDKSNLRDVRNESTPATPETE